MSRHRPARAALALLALGGLLLLGWWALTPSPGGQSAPRAPIPPAAPASAVAAPVAPRPPVLARAPAALADAAPSSALETPPPGTTPERPPDAPPIDLPPTTQMLTEEFYPGTTDWEEVPVDESHQQRLRILPRRYNVVAPRPLAVWLELTDGQGRRQPLPPAQVRLRPLDDATRPWLDLPVTDDGTGEDEQAGDLRYTAQLRPTREQQRALFGRVLVEARVDVPGVGPRTIPSIILYTPGPRAALTGRWTDSMRQGSLALEAELRVEEPGLFTLMAQVFGPRMEPLAWVKQTTRLGAGRRTMTLEVFGKVLHDLGVDGPYRVRQVLLTRDQENSSDYDPGETVEEAHQTGPYAARSFSQDAWTPPPRTIEDITAAHPTQQDKPPPERTRAMDPDPSAAPAPSAGMPPSQAIDLGGG